MHEIDKHEKKIHIVVKTFEVKGPMKMIYFFFVLFLRTPKLLDGFNYESKSENIGRKRSWGALPGL